MYCICLSQGLSPHVVEEAHSRKPCSLWKQVREKALGSHRSHLEYHLESRPQLLYPSSFHCQISKGKDGCEISHAEISGLNGKEGSSLELESAHQGAVDLDIGQSGDSGRVELSSLSMLGVKENY